MKEIGIGFFIIISVCASLSVGADILFTEYFEDQSFSSRGWYDGTPRGTLSTDTVAGSTRSFECLYRQGAQGCAGGTPARRAFTPSETVYVSYWTKYSSDWQGSNKPYHPHEFMLFTNKDGIYVAPANSHLSIYIEQVEQVPRIALQDSQNVNGGCILRNNQPIDACDSYDFGEARSVASCNGIDGDLDERDCYNTGSYWYSSRGWTANDSYFSDLQGKYYKNDWHFIEAMVQMNSVQNGIGIPDGKIRYWYDGELLISSDSILFRTGANSDQKFNQFFFGQYIGDGSPIDQRQWIDNLTVSTHRIGYTAQSACDDTAVCTDAVFCSGFEEGSKSIWDDYDGNPDSTNLLMDEPGPCNSPGNTVMRLRAPAGRGGADLVKVLPSTYDRLYARWYQRWEPGYDFTAANHGGGLHAGDRNYLGRSDYQPSGSDFAGTWLEPNPGIGARPNLYSYYRGMYQNCADPNGQCWGDNFPCMTDEGYFCEKPEHRETLMTPQMQAGKWYCMEIMMDMGTPVQSDSLADGVQNLWVDGIEYGPFEHLWHRTTANLKLSILWLSLFHHGEHSVEGIMLDNVVVSNERIGCLGASAPSRCTDTDLNSDGRLSSSEMNSCIAGWRSGQLSLQQLMTSIRAWKAGC